MIQDEVRRYREIRDDYEWHPDIFDQDEERVSEVKRIITQKLSPVDRTIMLLYVDCQSLRKLGKRLGVSHMTCKKEIERIRRIIIREYEHIHTDGARVGGDGVHR